MSALMPEPAHLEVQLSRAYGNSHYRATATQPAKYFSASNSVACDECLARQHEAHGTTAFTTTVRNGARHKRVLDDGPVLYLCGADTQRWRERDLTDGAPR